MPLSNLHVLSLMTAFLRCCCRSCERNNSYYFSRANQQKAGTKIYSLTQCSLTVNECDWHILAGNTRELIHIVWLDDQEKIYRFLLKLIEGWTLSQIPLKAGVSMWVDTWVPGFFVWYMMRYQECYPYLIYSNWQETCRNQRSYTQQQMSILFWVYISGLAKSLVAMTNSFWTTSWLKYFIYQKMCHLSYSKISETVLSTPYLLHLVKKVKS